MATVRARYEKGVLTPLEPLEFEDGAEVIVAVERETALSQSDNAESAHPILAIIEEIHEDVPEPEEYRIPRDGARNYKHYLYGHPKEEDA